MEKSLLVESQGCLLVMLVGTKPPSRESGTTLYDMVFLEVGSIYLYMHWL